MHCSDGCMLVTLVCIPYSLRKVECTFDKYAQRNKRGSLHAKGPMAYWNPNLMLGKVICRLQQIQYTGGGGGNLST